MSIPFRDDPVSAAVGGPGAARAPGRPRPSQVIRCLGALEQAPALFALPDHALRRLARRLRPVELGEGRTLVDRGTTGDSLYLIERGTCHVTAGAGQDGAGRLAHLRAGVPAGDPVDVELRQQIARREAGYRVMAERVRRDAELSAGEARLVAMYSPGGGVGRTTIGLNLAAQLAQGHAGEVLLLDLDLPYTPAALLAGLVPTDSLVRASWSAVLGTSSELLDALTSAAQPHETGFLLLAGTVRLAESELITAEQVTTALEALGGAFRHIVVDLGSSLGDLTLSVCDRARHVVLVVPPELPSLKGAREALDLFEELHIPDDRR